MDARQRAEWMWENCRETCGAAKAGIQTNYYGTKNVTEALLPLLQASSDGRIVNVSSDFGLLSVSSSSDSAPFQIIHTGDEKSFFFFFPEAKFFF